MEEKLELSLQDDKTFESIRHVSEDGVEYWLARELAPLLGYSTWQKFSTLIERAKTSCQKFGKNVDDHFNLVVKMVRLGSGSERKISQIEAKKKKELK